MSMKKNLILALLVVAAGSVAYAQAPQNFLWTPNAPNVGLGELYNSADIWPNVDKPPRALPVPEFSMDGEARTPGEGAAPKFQSTIGPMAVAQKGMIDGNRTGSAIVSPRGGSFMTPRREADKAIRKLIGQLD